jgi:hypothetical protein
LAPDAVQIDAIEQHLQVGGTDLNPGLTGRRKAKGARL